MSSPRPVLIIDDDADLRATLAEQLSLEQEFQVTEAGTAGEAEAMLNLPNNRCDAILLDIGLPDGNGRELCIKLRKQGLRMPVIMLTGADAEADIVRGLDAGANDYIAKPFRLNELLARLRAQLRVFDNSEDAVFTIGPYSFRPSAKLLLESTRNRKIRLTEKEAAGVPVVIISVNENKEGLEVYILPCNAYMPCPVGNEVICTGISMAEPSTTFAQENLRLVSNN